MANIMTKRGSADNVLVYEHICDTLADKDNIDSRYITLGTICIVLNGDGGALEVFMADSSKQWHEL